MKSIEINIGNLCNNECKFCMVDYENDHSFINFAMIKKEILRAKKQGGDSIGFLGGEFTLHPEILKIIKLCKLLNFRTIHIISNGRKYQDKGFVEQLIKNGVNRFSVSLHSHKPEVEDYLTQRTGGFKEKLAGLKNLIFFYKMGLIRNSISVNIVINGVNYKDILETLKYFNKLGIADFRLNFIWLHGRAQKFPELFIRYTDIQEVVRKIINYADKQKINISFEGIPFCLINNDKKLDYIGESRDLDTELIAYNNPDKRREQFDWKLRKKNEFKVKHENCFKCVWDKMCDGIWMDYINKYGWGEFKF